MSFISPVVFSKKRQKIALIIVFYLFLNLVLPIFTPKSHAAALTEAAVRLDRMGGGLQF